MPRERSLDQRVRALERRLESTPDTPRSPAAEPSGEAVSPGPDPEGTVAGAPGESQEPAALEARLSSLEAEVAELSAGLQALRGYVGNVDHVNESVERRANAALAAVERLEAAPGAPPLAKIEQEARAEDAGDASQAGVEPPGSENESDQDSGGAGILERLGAMG